jgi:hypothetical protein
MYIPSNMFPTRSVEVPRPNLQVSGYEARPAVY